MSDDRFFAALGLDPERIDERVSVASCDGSATVPDEDLEVAGGRRPSQATLLVRLGEQMELIHTPDDEPFASIEVDGHSEIYPVRSKAIRRWLARKFYEEYGSAPNSQALNDALSVIEGRAVFRAPEVPVYTRLAEHEGTVYLDLADDGWRVIAIDADGWRVVADPPVRFRRASGMLPLPFPEHGGTIDELRPFLNLGTEGDWILLAAWLVAALRPRGPYAVLALNGEQGSAKSTLARLLRSLLDPNEAALRAEPRNEHDLVIAARNGWVIALDNLSRLPGWLSDAICRLATGSGFGTRQLYTNDEEVIFSAQRPVILNGIEEIATRGDLLDRAIVLSLPPIPDERRQDEQTFFEAFKVARPRILGALLDAVSTALRNVDSVRLARAPRMADLARWTVAAEPALPWPDGAFLLAYESNRSQATSVTLEASLISEPLLAVADQGFSGTPTELLIRLEALVDEDVRRKKDWPGAAHVLSGQLRRLAPAFRTLGVEIDFGRGARTRIITIRKGPQTSVTSVTDKLEGQSDDDACDADDASSQALSDENDAESNGSADIARSSQTTVLRRASVVTNTCRLCGAEIEPLALSCDDCLRPRTRGRRAGA